MGYTIRLGPDGDALVSRESSPDKDKKPDKNTSSTKAETKSSTSTAPTKSPDQEQRTTHASTPAQAADVAGIGGAGGIAATGARAEIEAKVKAAATEQKKQEAFIANDPLDSGYESPDSRDDEDGGVSLEREEDGGVKLDQEETDDEDSETRRKEH